MYWKEGLCRYADCAGGGGGGGRAGGRREDGASGAGRTHSFHAFPRPPRQFTAPLHAELGQRRRGAWVAHAAVAAAQLLRTPLACPRQPPHSRKRVLYRETCARRASALNPWMRGTNRQRAEQHDSPSWPRETARRTQKVQHFSRGFIAGRGPPRPRRRARRRRRRRAGLSKRLSAPAVCTCSVDASHMRPWTGYTLAPAPGQRGRLCPPAGPSFSLCARAGLLCLSRCGG